MGRPCLESESAAELSAQVAAAAAERSVPEWAEAQAEFHLTGEGAEESRTRTRGPTIEAVDWGLVPSESEIYSIYLLMAIRFSPNLMSKKIYG